MFKLKLFLIIFSLFLGANIANAQNVRPVRLSIASIKLNKNIIDVGLTEKGNLDVPPNYKEVGWYKYGAKPGEVGTTVLDGHVDNGKNIPGPFKNLKKIKLGDEIYVRGDDDKLFKYIVKST